MIIVNAVIDEAGEIFHQHVCLVVVRVQIHEGVHVWDVYGEAVIGNHIEAAGANCSGERDHCFDGAVL